MQTTDRVRKSNFCGVVALRIELSEECLNEKYNGGTDGTRTRDPLRDRQVF